MRPLVYLDTETTGIDSQDCGLTQIAALMEYDGEIIGSFDSFVQPPDDASISDEAVEITGIEPSQYSTFPSETNVYERFVTFLNETNPVDRKPAICAYNIAFDFEFLSGLFARHEDRICNHLSPGYSLDPLTLFSFISMNIPSLKNSRRTLESVANSLDVRNERTLHDAREDTALLYGVLQQLNKLVRGFGTPSMTGRRHPRLPKRIAYIDQTHHKNWSLRLRLMVEEKNVGHFELNLPARDGFADLRPYMALTFDSDDWLGYEHKQLTRFVRRFQAIQEEHGTFAVCGEQAQWDLRNLSRALNQGFDDYPDPLRFDRMFTLPVYRSFICYRGFAHSRPDRPWGRPHPLHEHQYERELDFLCRGTRVRGRDMLDNVAVSWSSLVS